MNEQPHLLGAPVDRFPAPRGNVSGALDIPRELAIEDEFEKDGLDLATIWQVVWTHRFWILGAGGIGLLLALIVSFLQTPLYRSTAVLELNPPTVPILTGQGGDDSGNLVVPNTDYEFLATQYGLLKSRNLAQHVVQDLGLANDKALGDSGLKPEQRIAMLTDQLAAGISVSPVRDSRLVEMTYTSPEAAQASRIVNGFAEAFLTSTLDRRYEATSKARAFLEKRLKAVRTNLDESERKLVEYAKKNNIITTTSDSEGKSDADSLSGESLVALNAALAQAQQKRITAEQRYRQAGSITEVTQSTSTLRQEKASLETEYQEKSTYLGKDYPEMVRLRSRIDALDKALRKEASSASGALYAEFKAAQAEENALQGRVKQLSANVLDLRERSIQYNMLKRELDTNRSLYDALLDRYNKIGVSGGIGTPNASVVDRGETPAAPFSPNIPQNLLLGLFLGLGLGTAGAFAYHFVTDTISSAEDVRDKLGLPALGVIPKKKRRDELNDQIKDRHSAISEAYASLLTTLQFTTNAGMPQALLVTSTKPGEGKSTTSFALASNLAQLGRRVLLIDGDMRKPSFIVEENSDCGLSRLLVGQGSVREHILKTQLENLWLMPSGPVPPNPAQLLNSNLAAFVIEQTKLDFDFVVVDAPPALGLADTKLLAANCDAVLLVIESGRTRRQPAREVVDGLRATGCVIVGAALTKHSNTPGGYGYGYGYGYDQNPDSPALPGRKEPHELTVQLMGNGGD